MTLFFQAIVHFNFSFYRLQSNSLCDIIYLSGDFMSFYEQAADKTEYSYFQHRTITVTPAHIHAAVEFLFVESGSQQIIVDGESFTVNAGEGCFYDSFSVHAYEKVFDAIKENEYGRCVFHCNNDAVNNQIVMMEFENGIKAELTMTAFAGGRRYHLFGTLGNVLLDGANITVTVFSNKEKSYTIKVNDLIEKGHVHGGGDGKLLATLYDMLSGNAPESTSLAASIESHLRAYAPKNPDFSMDKCSTYINNTKGLID